MAKKKARKITRNKRRLSNSSALLFIGIVVALLFLVASSKSLFKSQTATSGKSLGAFLAKGDEGGIEDNEDNEDNDEESSGSSGSSSSGSSGGSSDSGSSGSGSSGSSDSSSGSSGSSNSGESTSKIIFVNPTTGVKTEIEREQNRNEIKMEIQSGDDKVKTETKEGKTKVEGRVAGMKVRFEVEDGRLVLKHENEDEDEDEIEDEQELDEIEEELDEDEIEEVENELEEEDIKVSTEGGSLVVLRRGIGARTTLPISIDTSTNSLIVTTPAGTKVVTILPDVAINNLIEANVLSVIMSRPAEAAELTEEEEDHLVFEVEGIKKEKFLGLFTVSLKKKVIMNAQTAQVEQELESFLTRLLDILSV